ncbi:MAG: HAMP domain-containing protein [Deltaproteobacteria bacterium]|nr:HAMP domain-containing protein [Deltaproteobacteria bacterium]MBW2378580.1 HAMP domain-containing protein [Deltaproteobacteria bacterium]
MNRFSTRIVVLFALVATFPVALTGIVWLGVSHWGAGTGTAEAEMARTQLRELDAQRKAAVSRLCRDDLAVDTLLDERARERPSELDYDRLFRGSMQAAGLQALWVLDSLSGEVIATGHRHKVLGNEGAQLTRQARSAGDRAYVVTLGDQEHQRFLVRSCSIARGGAHVTLIAGHRFSDLRRLDPRQLVITGEASKRDEVVMELVDAEGVPRGAVVWRPRFDRRGPPLLLWIACVAVLALGLALMFGGYLNRWLQSSVDELTAAATRVGRGDFDTTLRDGPRGAFPATATAFNRMTRDLRDAREQLRQTERIAAWQDIAKSLAHELKNPLSPIRLSIETLRKARERSHDDFDTLFDESTKTILQEVERLRNIVDEFSRFARLPAPKLETTDLREVVKQTASLHAKGDAPVTANLPGEPVEAFVDADQITQVLHNLVQNARDAAREAHPAGGGTVGLALQKKAGTITIRVEDNGAGIPADQAEAIFEPYYTRKEGGTGLGLAITQRIVTEHGGRIDVESRAGRTVFTVVLPHA